MELLLEPLEPRVMFSGNPSTAPRIIDDGGEGFFTSGIWSEAAGDGLAGDTRSAVADPATLALWRFDGISPGYRYRVSTTWVADDSNTDQARFAVIASANTATQWVLDVASVDQTQLPNGGSHLGASWEDLSEPLLVRGTTLSIVLYGALGEKLLADAVRIERIGEWVAPIGVATPKFGIDESHWQYAGAGKRYSFGAGPEPYRIGPDGPYTHYVDNTHPQATDDDNPFGRPDRPRETLPESVQAGSVVEVHGGPYNYAGSLSFFANGAPARPVYLRGTPAEIPIFQMEAEISGKYVIVENLEFVGERLVLDDKPHHVSLRNLEIHDFNPSGNNNAIYMDGRDLVLYNSRIYQNGDPLSLDEVDVHGVKARGVRVWLVDNLMHDNGGDSIQIKGAGNISYNAQYIYIARNVLHDDRENAVDIKASQNVFVSQNVMYGYEPTIGEGSDGTALIGAHEGAKIGWFLFNEIYDSTRGIRINESKSKTRAYMIGNVIHGIEDAAIYARYESTTHVVNNVIYDSGIGFHGDNRDSDYHLYNNIFYDLNSHIVVERSERSETHHNILYQPGGTPTVEWLGEVYSGLASFQTTGQGEGSIEADPLLLNPAGGDVRIGEGSPAIDAGASIRYLQRMFFQRYGRKLDVDFLGAPRTQGSQVDIGAYEGAAILQSLPPLMGGEGEPPEDIGATSMSVQLGREQNQWIRFTDSQRTNVTLRLEGAGSATVRFAGENIEQTASGRGVVCTGDNLEITEIVLQGTNERSDLIVKAWGGDEQVVLQGIQGGQLGRIDAKRAKLIGANHLESLGELRVGQIDGASLDVDGTLGYVRTYSIINSQIHSLASGRKWRVSGGVVNSSLTVDTGMFDIRIDGSVVCSTFDFDESNLIFVRGAMGGLQVQQGQQTITVQSQMVGRLAGKISINGWLTDSVIAIGVDPGSGGYFDGDETAVGGALGLLQIGGYLPNDGQAHYGVIADALGRVRIGRQTVYGDELPYANGAFSIVTI